MNDYHNFPNSNNSPRNLFLIIRPRTINLARVFPDRIQSASNAIAGGIYFALFSFTAGTTPAPVTRQPGFAIADLGPG